MKNKKYKQRHTYYQIYANKALSEGRVPKIKFKDFHPSYLETKPRTAKAKATPTRRRSITTARTETIEGGLRQAEISEGTISKLRRRRKR